MLKNKNYAFNTEDLINFYNKNPSMTQIEIAKKFNISRRCLQRFLYQNNIFRPKNRPIGNKNGKWKGGFLINRNRKYIYQGPNKKYIEESRIIMEQKLGRKLDRKEIVHHINGNVQDNNPDNLLVMSQNEHIKIHHKDMTARRLLINQLENEV